MNCKEAQAYIKPYIEEDMDLDQLAEFMQHIKHCPECYDELEIRYLVREGLLRLEDGEAFNLKTELNRRMDYSWRLVSIGEKIKLGIYILETFCGMILAVCMILLLVNI